MDRCNPCNTTPLDKDEIRFNESIVALQGSLTLKRLGFHSLSDTIFAALYQNGFISLGEDPIHSVNDWKLIFNTLKLFPVDIRTLLLSSNTTKQLSNTFELHNTSCSCVVAPLSNDSTNHLVRLEQDHINRHNKFLMTTPAIPTCQDHYRHHHELHTESHIHNDIPNPFTSLVSSLYDLGDIDSVAQLSEAINTFMSSYRMNSFHMIRHLQQRPSYLFYRDRRRGLPQVSSSVFTLRKFGSRPLTGSADYEAKVFEELAFNFYRRLAIYCHQYFEQDIQGHFIPAKIYHIRFSSTGSSFLTAGDDGLIKLWDSNTCRLCYTIKRHFCDISDLDFCWDDYLVVSCCSMNQFKLWYLEDKRWFPLRTVVLPALPTFVRFLPRFHTEYVSDVVCMDSLIPPNVSSTGLNQTQKHDRLQHLGHPVLSELFNPITLPPLPEITQTLLQEDKFMMNTCDDGYIRLYYINDIITAQHDFTPTHIPSQESTEIDPVDGINHTYVSMSETHNGLLSSNAIQPIYTIYLGDFVVRSFDMFPRAFKSVSEDDNNEQIIWSIFIALGLEHHQTAIPAHCRTHDHSPVTISNNHMLKPFNPIIINDKESLSSQSCVCRLDIRFLDPHHKNKQTIHISHQWISLPIFSSTVPDVAFGITLPHRIVSATDDGKIYIWTHSLPDINYQSKQEYNISFIKSLRLYSLIEEKRRLNEYKFYQHPLSATTLHHQTIEPSILSQSGLSPVGSHTLISPAIPKKMSNRNAAFVTYVSALSWSDGDRILVVGHSIARSTEKNKRHEKTITRDTEISFFDTATGSRLLSIADNKKIKSNISFMRSHPIVSSLVLIGTFHGQILLVNAKHSDILLFLSLCHIHIRNIPSGEIHTYFSNTNEHYHPHDIVSPLINSPLNPPKSLPVTPINDIITLPSGLIFNTNLRCIETLTTHTFNDFTTDTDMYPTIIYKFMTFPKVSFLDGQWSPTGDFFIVSQKDGSFSIFTANGCTQFQQIFRLSDAYSATPVEQFFNTDFCVLQTNSTQERVFCPYTNVEPHRMAIGTYVDGNRLPLPFYCIPPPSRLHHSRLPLSTIEQRFSYSDTLQDDENNQSEYTLLSTCTTSFEPILVQEYNKMKVDDFGNVTSCIGYSSPRSRTVSNHTITASSETPSNVHLSQPSQDDTIVPTLTSSVPSIETGRYGTILSTALTIDDDSEYSWNERRSSNRLQRTQRRGETNNSLRQTETNINQDSIQQQQQQLILSSSSASTRSSSTSSSSSLLSCSSESIPECHPAHIQSDSSNHADELVDETSTLEVPMTSSVSLFETPPQRGHGGFRHFWRYHDDAINQLRNLIQTIPYNPLNSITHDIPQNRLIIIRTVDNIFRNPSELQHWDTEQRLLLLDRLRAAARDYRHEQRCVRRLKNETTLSLRSNNCIVPPQDVTYQRPIRTILTRSSLSLECASSSSSSSSSSSLLTKRNTNFHRLRKCGKTGKNQSTIRFSRKYRRHKKRKRLERHRDLPINCEIQHTQQRSSRLHDKNVLKNSQKTCHHHIPSEDDLTTPYLKRTQQLSDHPDTLSDTIDLTMRSKKRRITTIQPQIYHKNSIESETNELSDLNGVYSSTQINDHISSEFTSIYLKQLLDSQLLSDKDTHWYTQLGCIPLSLQSSFTGPIFLCRQLIGFYLRLLFSHELCASRNIPALLNHTPLSHLFSKFPYSIAESFIDASWNTPIDDKPLSLSCSICNDVGFPILEPSLNPIILSSFFSTQSQSLQSTSIHSLDQLTRTFLSCISKSMRQETTVCCHQTSQQKEGTIDVFSNMASHPILTTFKQLQENINLNHQQLLEDIMFYPNQINENHKTIPKTSYTLTDLFLGTHINNKRPLLGPFILPDKHLNSFKKSQNEFWIHPECFYVMFSYVDKRTRLLHITNDQYLSDASEFLKHISLFECERCKQPGASVTCKKCTSRFHWHCSQHLWIDAEETRRTRYQGTTTGYLQKKNFPDSLTWDTFICPKSSCTPSLRCYTPLLTRRIFSTLQGIQSRSWLLNDTRSLGDYVPQLGDIVRFFPAEFLETSVIGKPFLPFLESPLLAGLPTDVVVVDITFQFPGSRGIPSLKDIDSQNPHCYILALLSLLILPPHPNAGKIFFAPCFPTDCQPFVLLSEVHLGLDRLKLMKIGIPGLLFIDGSFQKGIITKLNTSTKESILCPPTHPSTMAYRTRSNSDTPHDYDFKKFNILTETHSTFHQFWLTQTTSRTQDSTILRDLLLKAIIAERFTDGVAAVELSWTSDDSSYENTTSCVGQDLKNKSKIKQSVIKHLSRSRNEFLPSVKRLQNKSYDESPKSSHSDSSVVSDQYPTLYNSWEIFFDPSLNGAGGNEMIPLDKQKRLIHSVSLAANRQKNASSTRMALRSRTIKEDPIEDNLEYKTFLHPVPNPSYNQLRIDNDKEDWVLDYWTEIPLPISLTLIQRRLEKGYYRSELAFLFDLRLLYLNSVHFNGIHDSTTTLAIRLLKSIISDIVKDTPDTLPESMTLNHTHIS